MENKDFRPNNNGIRLSTIKFDPNNPNTFTVSEEEAARLRSMAMANSNGNLTPEMQKAMGMINNNYEQKIPKDIHNHICYDEAKKNNEKYRKEAQVFTNELIEDNSTKEILDEAEATTNLSEFDFGNIDEYLEKLNDLSFLEAVSFRKKIDNEIARWKSCKSMLKAISDLRLDDSVNRELMKINAMEEYKFTNTIEDFESHYEDNLAKMEKIAARLGENINAHKHEMESTTFLTKEMIHLMRGKIFKLSPNSMNYEYNKNRMETVVEAFENRLDLTYLSSKLDIYLRTNHNNIKKYFKDDVKQLSNNRKTKIINDLVRFFSDDIMYSVSERLMWAFNDDVDAVYLMLGFLAKVMNTEDKTAKNTWVKVFILNLSDIKNGIFDIEVDGSCEGCRFMKNVYSTFYHKLKNYLKTKKISLNISTSFGLKTPERVFKNDTENETGLHMSTTPIENTADNIPLVEVEPVSMDEMKFSDEDFKKI